MRVISPLDLRRSLGAILDAASAGERFVIERDRRPLAMLVSIEDGRRLEPDAAAARDRRLAALERLEAIGRRAPARPAGRAAAPSVVADRAATPVPAAVPVPDAPPAPAAPTATAERPRPDPHLAERDRHAGEGLVGLG